MAKPKGIIVFEGKSQLDGKPIVAIATGIKDKTSNEKIGNMIPIWIMRKDINPVLAVKFGDDISVCPDDCKHKHFGSCYVNIFQAPSRIYEAYHRGTYEKLNDDNIKYFEGRNIRLGAYGDPTAIPLDIWDKICSVSSGYTAYTHNWRKKQFQDYKKYCMASVEMDKEYLKAISMGWRTFRARVESEKVSKKEFICPASKEGKKVTSCSKCKACSGTSGKGKCPTIIVHGGGANGFRAKRFIEGMKKVRAKKKYKIDYQSKKDIICSL